VGQQLAGEAEAERFFAADSHRRQRVGLVGETESVPRVVVRQWGSLFIAQEVQVVAHLVRGQPQLLLESEVGGCALLAAGFFGVLVFELLFVSIAVPLAGRAGGKPGSAGGL